MNTILKILLVFILAVVSSCKIFTKINYSIAPPALPPVMTQLNGNEQAFTILPADTGLSIRRLDYLSLSLVAPKERYVMNITFDTSRMRSELEDSIYLVGGLVNFSKRFECVVNYSLSKSVIRNTRFYKQEGGGYDFYIPNDTIINSNVRSLYKFRQLRPTLQGDSMLKGYQFEIIDPNGNYFRFVGHTDPIFIIPFLVVAATTAYTSYKVYQASKSNQSAEKTTKKDDCNTKAKASFAYQSGQVQYRVVKSNCD